MAPYDVAESSAVQVETEAKLKPTLHIEGKSGAEFDLRPDTADLQDHEKCRLPSMDKDSLLGAFLAFRFRFAGHTPDKPAEMSTEHENHAGEGCTDYLERKKP